MLVKVLSFGEVYSAKLLKILDQLLVFLSVFSCSVHCVCLLHRRAVWRLFVYTVIVPLCKFFLNFCTKKKNTEVGFKYINVWLNSIFIDLGHILYNVLYKFDGLGHIFYNVLYKFEGLGHILYNLLYKI